MAEASSTHTDCPKEHKVNVVVLSLAFIYPHKYIDEEHLHC